MKNDEFEFKVSPIKAEIVYGILPCFLYAVACFIIIKNRPPLAFCIFSMVLLVLMVFFVGKAVAYTFIFYVSVSENHIEVRTRKRKKYEFDISDIKKVRCYNRTSLKTGPRYYLTFVTQSNSDSSDFLMVGSMKGFSKMAGYLLQKHNSGELRKNSISPHCQKELINYRDKIYKTK